MAVVQFGNGVGRNVALAPTGRGKHGPPASSLGRQVSVPRPTSTVRHGVSSRDGPIQRRRAYLYLDRSRLIFWIPGQDLDMLLVRTMTAKALSASCPKLKSQNCRRFAVVKVVL
jgi:hypothetical protein